MDYNNSHINYGAFAGFRPKNIIQINSDAFIGTDGFYKRFSDLSIEEVEAINSRLHSNDENALVK